MDFQNYLNDAGVPKEMHEQALACFKRAKKKSVPATIAGLFAPIVIAFLILTRQLKWNDNNVPKWAWWYDNNISINGDGWGTLLPDGTCLYYTDHELIAAGKGEAISYSDPRYTGTAYYAKNSHPRSAWARFVWLGFRNRASALAQAQGEAFDPKVTPTVWAKGDLEKDGEQYKIVYSSGLWNFDQRRMVFFGKLKMRRNCGFKIENAIGEGKSVAMCIYYQFAVKGA